MYHFGEAGDFWAHSYDDYIWAVFYSLISARLIKDCPFSREKAGFWFDRNLFGRAKTRNAMD